MNQLLHSSDPAEAAAEVEILKILKEQAAMLADGAKRQPLRRIIASRWQIALEESLEAATALRDRAEASQQEAAVAGAH